MPITLTCGCGQKRSVAPDFAGKSIPCLACGQALSVPAMGRLVVPKANRTTTANPKRSWLLPFLLIAAIVFVLFMSSGGALIWLIRNGAATERLQVAQNRDSGVTKVESEPPRIVLPTVPTPEPAKQNVKQEPPKDREPPMPLIEPAKATDSPKQVVEPIQVKEPLPAAAKQPANVMEPLKLVWKLKDEDTFYQELVITQKPTFKVQGLPIAMMLQYRIVSRFTVKKKNADGALLVEQKIESANLVQADELSKPSIAEVIARMPGTVYALELSAGMDVTKFDAALSNPKVANVALEGGLGMQMSSVLDRDGWRELAQATFFQLDHTPKANLKWSKPMTHNWGSLGSWGGQVHYQYVGQKAQLHQVSYGLKLAYKAPTGGGIGMMKINSANFQTQKAGGVLWFDANKGKVVSAEERFHVRGVLNANLLGQSTLIEIDEDQHFLIRVLDKMP